MSRVPEDVISYIVPEYLPLIDLYLGKSQYPEWEALYRQRLPLDAKITETWIDAAKKGDPELIRDLISSVGEEEANEIMENVRNHWYGGWPAMALTALDSYNMPVAEYFMEGRPIDDAYLDAYVEISIRLGSASDEWAAKIWNELKELPKTPEYNIFNFYTSTTDFVNLITRLCRLGLFTEDDMLESIPNLKMLDSMTASEVVELSYWTCFPDYNFSPTGRSIDDYNREIQKIKADAYIKYPISKSKSGRRFVYSRK